jgi:hypothetical protein
MSAETSGQDWKLRVNDILACIEKNPTLYSWDDF